MSGGALLYEPLADAPRLHAVPLHELSIGKPEVTLGVDDVDENRVSFVFRPYQAVRVTTEDCFVAPPDSGFEKGGVFVVNASPWIDELRSALAQVDGLATFLDRSHHYVVGSGDDVVEVVAWGVTWDGPGGVGAHPG